MPSRAATSATVASRQRSVTTAAAASSMPLGVKRAGRAMGLYRSAPQSEPQGSPCEGSSSPAVDQSQLARSMRRLLWPPAFPGMGLRRGAHQVRISSSFTEPQLVTLAVRSRVNPDRMCDTSSRLSTAQLTRWSILDAHAVLVGRWKNPSAIRQ